MQNKTLPGFIREQTGIGDLSEKHIQWISLFVQHAYNVPKSKVVVYFEEDKKYIYAQPLDSDGKIIEKNNLSLCDELKDRKIGQIQKQISKHLKLDEYIVKIVRDLPVLVKKARNVNELAT